MGKTFKQAIFLMGFLLSLFTVLPTSAKAQGCDPILRHGVFDVENVVSETDIISIAFNWMRQKGYTTVQEAVSGGINFADISVGGDQSISNMSLNEAETLIKNNSISRSTFSKSVRAASTTIVNAWSKCMEGPGLRLSMFNTYNPKEFRLILKFNPIGDMIKTTLIHHPAIPSGITCLPQDVLKINLEIGFNTQEFVCTRSTYHAGSIVLTSSAGSASVDLKEIPRPLPQPKYKQLETNDLIKLKCRNCVGDWWLQGVSERSEGQEQVTLSNNRDSIRNIWKVIISDRVLRLSNNNKWLYGVPDRPDGNPPRSEDFRIVQLFGEHSPRNQWLVEYSASYGQSGVLSLKFINPSGVSGNYWLAGCPTATMKVCYATDARAGEWEVEFVRP